MKNTIMAGLAALSVAGGINKATAQENKYQIYTEEQRDSIADALCNNYHTIVYSKDNPIGQIFKEYNFSQEEQNDALNVICQRPEQRFIGNCMAIPDIKATLKQDSIAKDYPKECFQSILFEKDDFFNLPDSVQQHLKEFTNNVLFNIIGPYREYTGSPEVWEQLNQQAEQRLQAIEEENARLDKENARLDEEITKLDNGIKLIESLLNITKEYPLILPDADKPRNE